jgi:hypothetical protein
LCGIAGFAGVPIAKRQILTMALGVGIDRRGGHAAGYLAMRQDGSLDRGRTNKTWSTSDAGWMRTVWQSQLVAMHARWATCGRKIEQHAHPFKVQRQRKTVLWGMHNGVISNASHSAHRHKRNYTVDSLELFELLADNQLEKIARLNGYGAVAYVLGEDMKHIRLCRMSESADMCIARGKDSSSTIYGSTPSIVVNAAEHSGIEIEDPWELETGKVYVVDSRGKLSVTEEVLLIGLNPPQRAWTRKLTEEDFDGEINPVTSLLAAAKQSYVSTTARPHRLNPRRPAGANGVTISNKHGYAMSETLAARLDEDEKKWIQDQEERAAMHAGERPDRGMPREEGGRLKRYIIIDGKKHMLRNKFNDDDFRAAGYRLNDEGNWYLDDAPMDADAAARSLGLDPAQARAWNLGSRALS